MVVVAVVVVVVLVIVLVVTVVVLVIVVAVVVVVTVVTVDDVVVTLGSSEAPPAMPMSNTVSVLNRFRHCLASLGTTYTSIEYVNPASGTSPRSKR